MTGKLRLLMPLGHVFVMLNIRFWCHCPVGMTAELLLLVSIFIKRRKEWEGGKGEGGRGKSFRAKGEGRKKERKGKEKNISLTSPLTTTITNK